MTPTVITIAEDQAVQDAIKKMLAYRVSGLPVLNKQGFLVGIISESDFLYRIEIDTNRKVSRWLTFLAPGRAAAKYIHEYGRIVREIMSHDPITVQEYFPLENAVKIMEKNYIKRLPVMRGERVVGMLTRADVMRVVAERGNALPTLKDSDEAIRKKIMDGLSKQSWVEPSRIEVVVHDGIVTLFGTVSDDRMAKAVQLLAANVKGVHSTNNELRIMEPEFSSK
jgi:CBS domain-containing protein